MSFCCHILYSQFAEVVEHGGTWWNMVELIGCMGCQGKNRFCQEASGIAGRRTRRASIFGGVTRNSGKQQARCTGNGLHV